MWRAFSCMYRAGWPASFLKADWDRVVEFGGRCFVEKCLMFREGNSPTIYHMPASLLKTLAEVESRMDPRLNVMQLDDNCAVDKLGSARRTM
jgi:hypothetical protein